MKEREERNILIIISKTKFNKWDSHRSLFCFVFVFSVLKHVSLCLKSNLFHKLLYWLLPCVPYCYSLRNVVHLHNGVLHSIKNGILIFTGKCVELENIILSEVTQTLKDNYHMYSLISGFRHKAMKIRLQFTNPENIENYEDSKIDIHGSHLQGK